MACLSATTKAEERIDWDGAGAVDSSCMPTPTPSTGLRDASLTDSPHFRTVEKHSPDRRVSIEDEDDSAQALIVLKKAGIAQNISANCAHISTRTYTFGQPSSIPSLTRLPPRPSIEVHPAATCLSSAALTMRDDTRGIIVREEDYISTLTVSSATTISIDLSAASSVTIQDAAATTTTTSASSDSANSALGPLLGGLLGGFFGLIAIVGGIWSLWHYRRRIFGKQQTEDVIPSSPIHDYKPPALRRLPQPPTAVPQPEPTPPPYQYGRLGRPRSMLSTSSSPHSHSHSGERAGSRSHSSVLTSNYSPTPCATPLPGMGTAISPGPSLASSSRPTTPGPALSYPPSLQQYLSHGQRVSWPRYDPSASASTSEEGLERRGERERRPSRLSLTLANWNPETDPELDLSVLKPEEVEKAKTTEGESRGAKGDERQRDQEKEKDTDGSQQASDLSQLAHAASSGHVCA